MYEGKKSQSWAGWKIPVGEFIFYVLKAAGDEFVAVSEGAPMVGTSQCHGPRGRKALLVSWEGAGGHQTQPKERAKLPCLPAAVGSSKSSICQWQSSVMSTCCKLAEQL